MLQLMNGTELIDGGRGAVLLARQRTRHRSILVIDWTTSEKKKNPPFRILLSEIIKYNLSGCQKKKIGHRVGGLAEKKTNFFFSLTKLPS